VTSALVIGTFAPDFEYFLRLAPGGGYGHTLPGAFVLSLPLALLVLWLFHAYVKRPFCELLPNAFQRKVNPYLSQFQFNGARGFLLIVLSILIGIATHIAWDSFTHPTSWLAQHWAFLNQTVPMPFHRQIAYYKLFQHGSSVIGMAALSAWFTLWYRTANSDNNLVPQLSSTQRSQRIAFICVMATFCAFAWSFLFVHRDSREGMIGAAICTFIAVTWWQLVLYGIFVTKQRSQRPQTPRAMR
jgi:hypothetical protein